MILRLLRTQFSNVDQQGQHKNPIYIVLDTIIIHKYMKVKKNNEAYMKTFAYEMRN